MTTDLEGRSFNIADARKYLGGISQPQLYKLFKSGRIQSYKIGNRRYVAQSQLDKFRDEQVEVAEW
tara:strand:- start:2861 stop:3058 length:198 start_codon:yes stop_codon:yes gene_type:complete